MRIQIRRPVAVSIHGHRRVAHRGDQVDIADEIAGRLIGDGRAIALDEAPAETTEPDAPSLDNLTVEQLQELADERELSVTGTGAGGKVIKSDLIAALTTED